MKSDNYVRKDVLEAQIDNLLTAIDNANQRIDDLRDNINRLMALTGTLLGLLTIAVTIAIAFMK